MAEELEHKHTFHYNGNYDFSPSYGLDESYGKNFLGFDYRFPVSQFAVTTDPRTSNQIKAVSDKISTGTGTIEITGITPQVLESIPDQHLTEINRLKKLTGVDLTFHGPLIEPTGVSKQGWNESHREQAEKQMWSSIERAHKIDPDGNIVITFHSSNGLPDPETKVLTEEKDPFTGKVRTVPVTKEFWVVDERTGNFQNAIPEKDFLRDKEKLYERFHDDEKEAWFRSLQHINFNANAATHHIKGPLSRHGDMKKEDYHELYKKFVESPEEADKFIKSKTPEQQEAAKEIMNDILHGDIYLRDSYTGLQNLFNQAYESTKIKIDSSSASRTEKEKAKEDLEKLESYKKELYPMLKDIEKPENIQKLNDEILKGVHLLRTVSVPHSIRPLKEFAIDKGSDTFSNLALESYKKFGDTAPIISIENPPAGSGLSRAEEIRDMIKASREKFVKKAVNDGISESEAKEQAEKLIGATWDVGHINMIRKYGYGAKDVVKETEKIAPYVKHVHLSDNFGLEHTELPMGMGNVPTKKMLDLISQYNKQAKKVIETGGNWFQFFQKTPLRETLEAFGSPVYPMAMAPYWNQSQVFGAGNAYFAGYGMNPDVHHSVYGAGFSNLPVELGGQMAGKSRMSGNPLE